MSAAPRLHQAQPTPTWARDDVQYIGLVTSMVPSYPRRYGVMQPTGPKYITSNAPLTATLLTKHWRGTTTVATPLAVDGLARTSGLDVDAGGRAAVERTLAAAARLGITAYAILMDGNEHQGGHVFTTPYPATPAPVLKAYAVRIRDEAGLPKATELYPTGALIRLPFGYHVRNNTRGTLLLQDGHEFKLDEPTERRAGLAAVLALPGNTVEGVPVAPEPAHEATIEIDAARLAACWQHKDDLVRVHNGIKEPACMKVESTTIPALKVLRGTLKPLNADGRLDTSDALYIGVHGLVFHNRTPESIIVIASECYAFDGVRIGRKTARALRLDIERCMRTSIAEHAANGRTYTPHPYAFEYTRHANAHAAHPAPAPATAPGRPRVLRDFDYRTQAALLADGHDEHGNPRLLMTRAELAQRLGIKPATAAAIERRLTQLGVWQRQQRGQHGSMATVLPGKTSCFEGVNNAFSEVVEGVNNYGIEQPLGSDVCRTPTLQIENTDAAHRGEHPSLAPVATPQAATNPSRGATCGVFPQTPRPSLAVQLDEALAVYADAPNRRRRRIVCAYIDANYGPLGVSRLTFGWEYEAALDRLRLHALDQDGLYKEQHKRQRLHERACGRVKLQRTPGAQHMRPVLDTVCLVSLKGNPKQAKKLAYRLERVHAVLVGRGLPLEQPRMKRRNRAAPKPAATSAMQQYIDLCPATPEPAPLPVCPPPSRFDVAGMIERLKARNAGPA